MKEFFDNAVRYIEPYIVYPDIITTIIDILLLTVIIYSILKFVIRTTAGQVVKGVVVLVAVTWLSEFFGLSTINWILENVLSVGIIAVVIIFQPEIRRALEKFGHFSIFGTKQNGTAPSDASRVVNSIAAVAEAMSAKRWGVLIVIENKSGLQNYISSGISIDARVTEELLGNIFTHNAPLHDGAVIISGDRIIAAACMLPLSQNRDLSNQYGMRHRAAIGITEETDALAIVVSEETGYISIAEDGTLFRNVGVQRLRERLLEMLTVDVPDKKHVGSVLKGLSSNERKE